MRRPGHSCAASVTPDSSLSTSSSHTCSFTSHRDVVWITPTSSSPTTTTTAASKRSREPRSSQSQQPRVETSSKINLIMNFETLSLKWKRAYLIFKLAPKLFIFFATKSKKRSDFFWKLFSNLFRFSEQIQLLIRLSSFNLVTMLQIRFFDRNSRFGVIS